MYNANARVKFAWPLFTNNINNMQNVVLCNILIKFSFSHNGKLVWKQTVNNVNKNESEKLQEAKRITLHVDGMPI